MVLPASAFLSIKNVRTCEGWLYLTRVINVDAGLEGKLLRDDAALRAMIVGKAEIVGTAEGQLTLQLATLVMTLRLTDGSNQLCQFLTLGQFDILVE